MKRLLLVVFTALLGVTVYRCDAADTITQITVRYVNRSLLTWSPTGRSLLLSDWASNVVIKDQVILDRYESLLGSLLKLPPTDWTEERLKDCRAVFIFNTKSGAAYVLGVDAFLRCRWINSENISPQISGSDEFIELLPAYDYKTYVAGRAVRARQKIVVP